MTEAPDRVAKYLTGKSRKTREWGDLVQCVHIPIADLQVQFDSRLAIFTRASAVVFL